MRVDAVFHREPEMKQREESSKYDSQRSIFDELRGVLSGDETLCGMLDITSRRKKKILEGEIKDAKLSSFSSDFQMHSLNILNFLCIFFEKLDSGNTFTDVTGTNKTYINI